MGKQVPYVFISWKGDEELSLATLLKNWLEKFFQLEVFISADKCPNESDWQQTIRDAVGQSDFGIVMLSERNKEAPWIMYETGLLDATHKYDKLAPVIIDLEVRKQPEIFGTRQVYKFDKKGIIQLFGRIKNNIHPEEREKITLKQFLEKEFDNNSVEIQEVKEKLKKAYHTSLTSPSFHQKQQESMSDFSDREKTSTKTIEDELEWNVYSTDLVNQFFHDSEFRTYPSLDKRAYISELFIADKVTRQELFSIIIETRYNSSSSILGYENSYTVLLIDKEKNAKIRIYPQSPEEKEILSMEMLLHHPEKGRCGFPFSNKNISSYRLKKERQKEDRERKYRISNGTASPADVLQEQMSSMNVETLTKILHGKSSVNGN